MSLIILSIGMIEIGIVQEMKGKEIGIFDVGLLICF